MLYYRYRKEEKDERDRKDRRKDQKYSVQQSNQWSRAFKRYRDQQIDDQ